MILQMSAASNENEPGSDLDEPMASQSQVKFSIVNTFTNQLAFTRIHVQMKQVSLTLINLLYRVSQKKTL